MRTLIIAEAGVNHNGDLALAKALVARAAEAGADLVKFQTFVAERLVSPEAPKADYQRRSTASDESQQEMLRRLELSEADHRELLAECARQGIGFLSTAFDIESLSMLLELGIDYVKIPSGEITNLPYLRHAARSGKPLILSTGMATLGEVEAAVEALELAGAPRSRITVLHCTTEYPAPVEEVNLRAMQNLGAALGVEVGYSDHTVGIEIPIAAVALGARIIEKHFTLDRSLPGPDHRASLEPAELKAMVDGIRRVELALGDGVKRPGRSELGNRAVARKSLFARCEIQAGEPFSEQNLCARRPGTGLSPMRWDELIGRPAPRHFNADEPIEL